MAAANTNAVNISVEMAGMIESFLAGYNFTAEKKFETDGSVILCLDEIEFLISWGATEDEALTDMAKDILGYAGDYYNDYAKWSRGANTVKHIPYVLKALMLGDADKIKELIKCRHGEN